MHCSRVVLELTACLTAAGSLAVSLADEALCKQRYSSCLSRQDVDWKLQYCADLPAMVHLQVEEMTHVVPRKGSL